AESEFHRQGPKLLDVILGTGQLLLAGPLPGYGELPPGWVEPTVPKRTLGQFFVIGGRVAPVGRGICKKLGRLRSSEIAGWLWTDRQPRHQRICNALADDRPELSL